MARVAGLGVHHEPSHDGWLKAEASALLSSIVRRLRSAAASLVDAMPPYRRVEGRLTAKEAGPDGAFYLLVDDEIVEVDRLTFDALMVGEALRILSTRANQAINIDRLVP